MMPSTDSRDILYGHLRRFGRLAPWTVATWAVVAMGASRLAGMRTGGFELYDLIGALLCGVGIGGAMAWFETRPVRRGYINRRPWLDVVMRTVLYTAVVGAVVLIGRQLLFRVFPEEATAEVWRPVGEMVRDARIVRFMVLLLVASFVLNLALHLRLAIGPRHLRAMFLGTYRLPVREQRMFLFMDLIDSTAIAARLGPLEFTHFKHDFFCDLTEPILATDGQIVQYVGDEVMLTWAQRELSSARNPIRFLALTQNRLAHRAAYYRERYGTVPAFRTGVHAGEVVVAEVGDTRRDIVYSGDTVNAAARLLQGCRPAGLTMLLSEEAMSWLRAVGVEVAGVTPREPVLLRGRLEAMDVWGGSAVR